MALDVCREKLLLQAQVVGVEVGLVLLCEPAHILAPASTAQPKQPGIFGLEGVESAPFAVMTGFVRVAALPGLMPVLVPAVHSSRLIADNHFPPNVTDLGSGIRR